VYVRNEVRTSMILWFCWKHVLFFAAYSFAIVYAYLVAKWNFISIPFLPVGTIGTAVAFYVGFKNNASYERLWEGRKIWGSISNLSRALGAMLAAIPEQSNGEINIIRQRLSRRQIAWCNALRINLRAVSALRHANKLTPEAQLVQNIYGKDYGKESIDDYLIRSIDSADYEKVRGSYNAPLSLLSLQLADIEKLSAIKEWPSNICEKLLETIIECIKEQGAAERLKTFPFPRQYAHFSGVFVWIFLLLLPFGLVDELAKNSAGNLTWMVVPFNTLISWMFITMEQVGDSSEDPFELALNDVPLTSICRNIEIELLQLSGETTVPEPIKPVSDILL
jgi:putative membrane protein